MSSPRRQSLLLPQMASAAASHGSASLVPYNARLEKAETARRQQGIASEAATACGSPRTDPQPGPSAGAGRRPHLQPSGLGAERSSTEGMVKGDDADIDVKGQFCADYAVYFMAENS